MGRNTSVPQESTERKTDFRTNKVWKFFSSLKLALVLMFVLVALSLIGAFVIQIPAEYATTAADYNWWLENVASPQTGVWYPILHLLGLFNVFHSIWFLSAGALLIISIIICSINRWQQVRLKIAAQNRIAPIGSYLIHLSLILFITGFLVGSYLGFHDPSFIVAEGTTLPVGNGTTLSLYLDSFTSEYWPDGSPKDYSSQVILYDNNQEVERAVVQVNHPLSYKGIRFYQSYFGPSASIRITDPGGTVLYEGSVALSQSISNSTYMRPAQRLVLPQSGYIVYVIGRVNNGTDPDLKENQIGVEVYKNDAYQSLLSTKLDLGVPHKTDTLEITFTGEGEFSGFQVSRDPGNSLIWIASGLFMLGLIMVFYFPRRQRVITPLSKPDKEIKK